jgi:GNAT superfamily N-acetyltransferase
MEAARRAGPGDAGVMAGLARAGAAELEPLRGSSIFLAREARDEPFEAGFLAAVDDPEQGVWVGTIDDAVVGYAATSLASLPDGRRLAIVTDLYVEPCAREVGVGEALMVEVLAWAKGLGSAGVDAWALPGARQTKNFFEEQGFTARLLVMHHRFGSGA